MKKLALMLLLAVSMSGFAVGCSGDAAKKPAPAPVDDKAKMDEKAPDAATPPAKEEEKK